MEASVATVYPSITVGCLACVLTPRRSFFLASDSTSSVSILLLCVSNSARSASDSARISASRDPILRLACFATDGGVLRSPLLFAVFLEEYYCRSLL